MPDKKSDAVLAMLNEQVGCDYKVVKKQFLADSLPEKFRISVEKLVKTISFLKERDYISVKYQDKDEICLSLTVKAANYLSEKKHPTEQVRLSARQLWLCAAAVFAASFLGALAALLIGK